MPAAQIIYCNTGIEGLHDDLVFLIRCEFAVHLNISTACRIGFRMLFLYLFYNSIPIMFQFYAGSDQSHNGGKAGSSRMERPIMRISFARSEWNRVYF